MNNPKPRTAFDTDFKLQVVQTMKTKGPGIAQVCKDMELCDERCEALGGQFEAEQSEQSEQIDIGKLLTADY